MTAQVIPLRIKSERQDDLAGMIRRLEAQNREAAWRKEILEIIEGAESAIMYQESVIFYGRELLRQMDERGPTDAA